MLNENMNLEEANYAVLEWWKNIKDRYQNDTIKKASTEGRLAIKTFLIEQWEDENFAKEHLATHNHVNSGLIDPVHFENVFSRKCRYK